MLPAMHLRHLQLTGFRTYSYLDFEPPPGRVLFLGDNAQGKSNLLEAAYLLASGRSTRASQDSELIGWKRGAEEAPPDTPFARLQGTVERHDGDVSLELLVVGHGTSAASARAGKRYRVNGIARRAVDFVGQLRAVLFTADDLEIISGSPSGRRAYLDGMLSQQDRAYYAASHRYARITQQRNATLRRIREGVAAPDELSLWDDAFSKEASTIIAARQRAVHNLALLAAESHSELSGAAEERLEIAYLPQLGTEEWRRMLSAEATAVEVQPLFASALASQRRREIAAGISLVGPHRDEVSLTLNGVSLASFGSRAQIRTAALALRLAEARHFLWESGDPPLLLLDDVISELDERRRGSVLAGVSGFDQVWFTATTGSWLPPEFLAEARVYTVADGGISEG